MFEQIGAKSFLNREHTGEYAEIEFDTYVDNKGKEEILDITTPIHYYEAGQGDPMILVHGLGQTTYTWRKVFLQLSESFHVYAIDLPGHGFSGKPEMAYSIEEFALALEAFMNIKELRAANFCAFGESAVYVLDFAIHNAARTKGLILVSPVIATDGGLFKGNSLESVFGLMGSKGMNQAAVKTLLQTCYFDQTLVTDEVADEYLIGISDKDFKFIVRMCMTNFMDENVLANLHTVKSPVLVIVGADDKITGGKSSPFLDLGFERGSLLTVRNCGYLVQEEKPNKMVEAIKTFLNVK